DRNSLACQVKSILVCTEVCPLLAHDSECAVDHTDYGVGAIGSRDADKGRRMGKPTGALQPETLCGHGADMNLFPLVHVGSDMEPHACSNNIRAFVAGETSGQQIHSVELRVACNPVDFVNQLADFNLNLHSVL